MKKTLLFTLVLSVFVFVNVSCSTVKGVFGKKSSQESKQANKVLEVEKAQNKNDDARMKSIAEFASGIDYSLHKVTNITPPIQVAQDLNKRVVSLSGKPDLKKEKEMWSIVDNLTNQIDSIKKEGLAALAKKDKEIDILQKTTKSLMDEKDAEIEEYMKLASDTALVADTQKDKLDKMDSWMGLGAIVYGFKKLIFSSLWIIGIGGLIFFILRIASSSNAVAASIFGVFEHIVSWVINTIKVLFPKALSISGNVAKETYDITQNLLKKIIDNIQSLKEQQNKLGHDITLRELLEELDKKMDGSEKEMVTKIKKDMGY